MHAYKGFHAFEPGTNLRGWLGRIMRNHWISEHRRTERRPVEDLSDDVGTRILAASASPKSAAIQQSVEDALLAALPNSDLAAAFAALPCGTQLAMYYAEVEGYHHQEVADLLNIPLGTVMSRLYRGRRRLRDQLAALDSGRRTAGDGCPVSPRTCHLNEAD